MTHPDSDTLLRFVLETLDESGKHEVSRHLSQCGECLEAKDRLQEEVASLGQIEFTVDTPAPPRLLRRHLTVLAVSRWAAVLGAGFILGYLTANFSEPHHSIPVQQRFVPTRNAVDATEFIPCQAVDSKTTLGGAR